MQLSLPKMNPPNKVGVVLLLVLWLGACLPPAFSRQEATIGAARQDSPPLLLIARADPPEFLAPAPDDKETATERELGATITPFLGASQILTLLPTPERPAIAASDGVLRERPEVTAGVNVDLGTVKFNLGYTLPTHRVDEFIRPFGVDLVPGPDVKRFSLGVKIPF